MGVWERNNMPWSHWIQWGNDHAPTTVPQDISRGITIYNLTEDTVKEIGH